MIASQEIKNGKRRNCLVNFFGGGKRKKKLKKGLTCWMTGQFCAEFGVGKVKNTDKV
jgi:hypothetical protein